jgi:hypothetical protein
MSEQTIDKPVLPLHLTDTPPSILSEAQLAERWHIDVKTLLHWQAIGWGPEAFKLCRGENSPLAYHASDVLEHEAAARQRACETRQRRTRQKARAKTGPAEA